MLENIPKQNFFHTFSLTLTAGFAFLFLSVAFPQFTGLILLMSPFTNGFTAAMIHGAAQKQRVSEIFIISLLAFFICFMTMPLISICLTSPEENTRPAIGFLFFFPFYIFLPVYAAFAMLSILLGNLSGFVVALKFNR